MKQFKLVLAAVLISALTATISAERSSPVPFRIEVDLSGSEAKICLPKMDVFGERIFLKKILRDCEEGNAGVSAQQITAGARETRAPE